MAEETKLKSQMSEGDAVKFTDEELQSLQGLQNTYASISTQFGQLKVSRMNLMRQMDSLEQSVTEKYGPGSLNPETGEYKPVKSEETDNK